MEITIKNFAELLEKQQKECYGRRGFNTDRCFVTVIPGKKYTKVNVGDSGKYMIDGQNIFGIKAYGVINRGHYYGTLQSINDWNWGGYKAVKLVK